MLTLEMLKTLWPHGNSKIGGLLEAMAASAAAVFAKYGISSDLVIAHLMAQISHECGAGTQVVENLNYSEVRMMQVWPSRFPDYASTAGYANNPRNLANRVYNGRMGNAIGSDDGWNYRGRGSSQTTGKEGYARLSAKLGRDFIINPDLVNLPSLFLECGAADFIICGCLDFALKDDILGVTRKLNGGIIGLDQRKSWLSLWKKALAGASVAPSISTVSKPLPPPPVVVVPEMPDSALGKFFKALVALFSKGKPS